MESPKNFFKRHLRRPRSPSRPTAENPKTVFRSMVRAEHLRRDQARAGANVQVDLARAAAEDDMDRRWQQEAAEAMERVTREWAGDPNDFAGRLQALILAPPPQPPGFQDRLHRCNRCGRLTELSLDFDAHYCGHCNRWVESKCRDVNCRLCSRRPERPLP